MLIADWIQHQSQNQPKPDSQQLKLLLCHVLSVNSAWLIAHQDQSLTPTQIQQLDQLASQLAAGKPLNQITGRCAFWDLELLVNEHTLIPRPDTETLIEVVIDLSIKPQSILDLGTGSGALALVLARQFPTARVWACDVSTDALQVAEANRQALHIENLELLKSDWFTNIPVRPFDLIVSNPPYIASDDPHLEQLTHEPAQALVAANHGLAAYQAICRNSGAYLSPGAWLVFEHGWQQHQAVTALMTDSGFVNVSTRQDLQGHPRITFGQWPETPVRI